MGRMLPDVIVVMLLVGTVLADDKAREKDTVKVQGKWIITAYVSNGNDPKDKSPDSKMVGCHVEITADRFTVTAPKEDTKKQAICKIDATKDLKTIDLTFSKDQVLLGIYDFDGDT